MVRRVIWFGVGAGATIFVVVKVRQYARQASPSAVGQRLNDSAADLVASVRDFTDRVRAAMAEREAELRDALSLPD